MRNEDILKTLDLLIDKFREEEKKIGDREKPFFRGYINLCEPCQIDIFLLEEPIKFQLLLISHDTNCKDKEIVIGGPFKPDEFLIKLEEFLNKDEKWKRILPKESPIKNIDGSEITYGDIAIGTLANYFKSMNNLLFVKIKNNELYNIPVLWVDISIEEIFGDIEKFDYTRFFDEKLDLANKFANAEQQSKPIVTKLPPPKPGSKGSAVVLSSSNMPTNAQGYGVMFYPPVWIDKRPERALAEQVLKQPLMSKKAFDINFNNKKLIFNLDGFMGMECESKEKAIGVFNTFFGVAHLLGVLCFAVNEDDIAEIKIDTSKGEVGGMMMQGHSERMQLMHWMDSPENNRRFTVIKKETITSIVDLTRKIIVDQVIVSQLIFLLDGFTYLINSEYSQSFIMDWLIVEKFFANKWDKLLKDRNIAGKRKEDFKDIDKWDAYHKLELLNFVREIDDDTYKMLRDFNTKRNRLVHNGEQINYDDAEKLYEFALDIVKKNIGL